MDSGSCRRTLWPYDAKQAGPVPLPVYLRALCA